LWEELCCRLERRDKAKSSFYRLARKKPKTDFDDFDKYVIPRTVSEFRLSEKEQLTLKEIMRVLKDKDEPGGYEMATGRSRFDPRQRQDDFSSSLCVQIGSGAHPASCTMGTGGPFHGGKARPGVTLTTHPI
jgi:hypothetical protein